MTKHFEKFNVSDEEIVDLINYLVTNNISNRCTLNIAYKDYYTCGCVMDWQCDPIVYSNEELKNIKEHEDMFDYIEDISVVLKDDMYYLDIDILSYNFNDNACHKCEELKEEEVIYTKDLKPLQDFSNLIWTHGINAYSSNGNTALQNAIDLANNNFDICCAFDNQYCGSIGLYVSGDVLAVANNDICSYKLEDGTRGIPSLFIPTLINSIDKIDLSDKHHGEAILRNIVIHGMWVKDWYLELPKAKKDIKRIISKLGIDNVKVINHK